MQFLRNLVFPGGLTPHGYRYFWTSGPIGLRVASNSPIALSYLSIAITLLVHCSRKWREIPFSLKAVDFYDSCGTVHAPSLYLLLLHQALPRQAVNGGTEKSA